MLVSFFKAEGDLQRSRIVVLSFIGKPVQINIIIIDMITYRQFTMKEDICNCLKMTET